MKNFDEIEQLWRQQTVVVRDGAPAIRAVQTAADRIVKSRGRLLRLGAGILVFSIVVGQLLAVVNFVYGGRTPNAVALVHLGVMQGGQILFLIGMLRRLRAHRELRARSASSVRENLQVSLELIEREMHDYRWFVPVFALLLVLEVVALLNGYHLGYFDQAGLVRRLLALGVFMALVAWVAQRHYRRVLGPRRQELMTVLADLDAE